MKRFERGMFRRELLATIAATSLGGLFIEAEAGEPNAGTGVAMKREGQRVTFGRLIAIDGERLVTPTQSRVVGRELDLPPSWPMKP